MPVTLAQPAELELAARIRAAHEAAQAGACRVLEDAVRCGELLLEAKRAVGHGRWLPWLAENTGIGARQAQNYMRVAQHRDVVLAANTQSTAHLSAAVALLAEPRADHRPHPAWSGEVEWYTPQPYVEAARAVMGGIDLDPASSDHAQETVRAAAYHTLETDGLARPWRGRVWLNPPYRADLIAAFVEKLLDELEAGNVTEAVLLVHARTDAVWFHEAAGGAAAVCLTRGRIRFATPDGPGDSPTTGSAFLYFGDCPDRFARIFGDAGLVFLDRAAPVPTAPPAPAFGAGATLHAREMETCR